MIQDCFYDLHIIEKYKAEVYQCVGDEVVLTWQTKYGLQNLNCLETYFAFKNKIASKSEYYQKQYGLIPTFKAGMSSGKVMMVEVGEIKREIAYHGDTINIAARVQGLCNTFGKNLLISEHLFHQITENYEFKINYMDDFLLKGKTKKIKIYSVEKTIL